MKTLTRSKGLGLFLLVTLMLFIVSAWYTNSFLKEDVIDQQKEQLLTEIDLLTPYIVEKDSFIFNQAKLDAGISKNERLTILDSTGEVVYDSYLEEVEDAYRSKRPEVKVILEGTSLIGFSARESQTVGEKMLYMAKGIYYEDNLVGVIRLSEEYQGVSEYVSRFQKSVLLIFCLLLFSMLLMSYYIYKQNQKPLEFILPILKRAIKNPEKKQKVVDAPAQWQELYQTVYDLMDETNLLYYKQLQNEEKLHFLFENLDIGMFILNEDLEVVLANRVTEELFNKKWEKLPYEEWFKQPKMIRLIKQAVQTGDDSQGEIHLRTPKNRYLKIVIRQLLSEQNEYVGIIYDITEMRQMERVHEDFISNISHELKTPTTSIVGFAETLLAGAKDDPEASEEFLKIIENEGQRLLGLIQTIMMLLKTEKDVQITDTVQMDASMIVEKEIERYQYKLAAKNIEVIFDKTLSSPVELPGNAFQIIVKNLLENAIVYSEENSQIFIYLTKSNDELVLKVEDTGIGISESDQIRIFERFYRVSHSRQRHTGGSGLGLALVQHYAAILGGNVKLTSDIGEGTTVIVRLYLS